jgi:O-6-methylguanine DNA methyltransferase
MEEMDVTRALREIGRVEAPERLADRVLVSVGAVDSYAMVDTVVGQLAVAHNQHGVSGTMRTADSALFERWFSDRVGRLAHRVDELPRRMGTAVAEQISGEKRHALRYDLRELTPFERAVLEMTQRIPRGEVRPYAWVAREIGHPAAVRAVGSALARNPVPYLIPCHRVVRSDGMIGNYGGGGPTAKKAILRIEGMQPEEFDLLRSGRRLSGSTSTRIFCHPTCHNARRVTSRRRVYFRSVDEARAAGMRPCRVCRPVA